MKNENENFDDVYNEIKIFESLKDVISPSVY